MPDTSGETDDSAPDDTLNRLRSRLSKIIDMSLDDIERTLKTGPANAKAQIIRTTLPALVKTLGDDQKDTSIDRMRQEMKEIRAEQRKDIGRGLKESVEGLKSADGNTDDKIPEDDGNG